MVFSRVLVIWSVLGGAYSRGCSLFCSWGCLLFGVFLRVLVFLIRDDLIEQLMREIVDLKEHITELEEQREADHTLMGRLRNRLEQLEAELNDYKEIAEQTCNVSGWNILQNFSYHV